MTLRTIAVAAMALPLLAWAQAAPEPAAKKAAPKPPVEAIATVNGVPVPRARMEYVIRQQEARGAKLGDDARNSIRDNLINREVVTQEAQRSGLVRIPEVQLQLDMARQQVLIDAYINEVMRKNPVSDADVQKEYDRVRASQGAKEYKARHILVETEDEAKAVIAELKKGGKFEELAAKSSKDPGSKDRGGDLDWNVPGTYDRQFADAMIKLEKGKYSEAPVKTRFGFHVIQLDDVRDVQFPPLAEVKPRIQQQLTQRRVDEVVRGLRAKAKVE